MLSCDQAVELLDAPAQREISEETVRLLRMHLEVCCKCRARLDACGVTPFKTRAGTPPSVSPSNAMIMVPKEAYSGVLDRIFPGVLDENRNIEDQRATAPRLLLELLELSSGQRRLLVRNSSRYQVWGLAEEALRQVPLGWTDDPRRSEELALLGVEVIDTLRATGFRGRLLYDLKAEAWSFVANCRRIQTYTKEAQEAFGKAEQYLSQGSGDRLERARLFDLKASLFVDIGKFAVADELLTQAIADYRKLGERHLEGRAQMKRAQLLHHQGNVEEAIPVLQQAAGLIDVSAEPKLSFLLRKNLMLYLADSGRAAEAQKLLPEVRKLARSYGSRLESLRLLWTEGLLRRAVNQPELAIEALSQVREGFIVAEIGTDVALVSLDLAALYLESGRTEEARELATESIPLFTSRGVHREALAAWSLFREAAERDALTVGLVKEVATRIRNAQSSPVGDSGDLR